METFFDILFLAILSISISVNISVLKKIDKVEKSHELIRAECLGMLTDQNRSLLALRELLEPTKPMKSNNWDSIREAFKGPARVEINERN